MLIYLGHTCGSICDDMAKSAFSNTTVTFDTLLSSYIQPYSARQIQLKKCSIQEMSLNEMKDIITLV